MHLYEFVSKMLAPLNLAIVRRTTLDHVVGQLQSTQSQLGKQMPPGCSEHATEASLQAISEAYQGQVQAVQQNLLRHQIASKWNVVDFMQRERRKSAAFGPLQCPLCHHTAPLPEFKQMDSHCIFGGGILLRHQCPACDLVFGPEKMLGLSMQELTQDYEWHYQAYQEGDSTAQELRAFHALNPKRDGCYLNFGAGAWSRSVQMLRQEGWQVYAYEPHASASVGSEYSVQSKAALSGMRFDGIYSNNVLEHLRHPAEDLAYLRTLLNHGGTMAHATPCFEYLYEFTRFHLFFFLGRSQAVLAHRAGLTVREFIQDGEFMCSVLAPAES
jgi:hypothetical protein